MMRLWLFADELTFAASLNDTCKVTSSLEKVTYTSGNIINDIYKERSHIVVNVRRWYECLQLILAVELCGGRRVTYQKLLKNITSTIAESLVSKKHEKK